MQNVLVNKIFAFTQKTKRNKQKNPEREKKKHIAIGLMFMMDPASDRYFTRNMQHKVNFCCKAD